MSVATVRRMRRKARYGLQEAQATTFTVRHEPTTPTHWGHDTRVIYPQPMVAAGREIDRAEWSRVILELLDAEAGGNRTRLAEMVGVTYLTVKRWIDARNTVSEDSVRAVARAFNMSAIDLLIRVGYYQIDELAPAPAVVGPAKGAPTDEIRDLIDAAAITPSEKRELHKQVALKRAEAEAALKADTERWIAVLRRPRRRTAS